MEPHAIKPRLFMLAIIFFSWAALGIINKTREDYIAAFGLIRQFFS